MKLGLIRIWAGTKWDRRTLLLNSGSTAPCVLGDFSHQRINSSKTLSVSYAFLPSSSNTSTMYISHTTLSSTLTLLSLQIKPHTTTTLRLGNLEVTTYSRSNAVSLCFAPTFSCCRSTPSLLNICMYLSLKNEMCRRIDEVVFYILLNDY